MRTIRVFMLVAALFAASPVLAATIRGTVSDSTGAAVPGARVVLHVVATGQETVVETDQEGKYRFDAPAVGTYLLIVTRGGFSEIARTVIVEQLEADLDMPMTLEIGVLSAEVSVTASLSEREVRQIPLHVETISAAAIEQANTLSTGDALTTAVNITPVGNGPFGVRPRLRGLDSTRLLVLVDGERLNTARQATDRTGAEVGLVSPDSITRMEIVNGAGTLMYGSDALAGTINIITNEPVFTPNKQLLYGFNGFYSTNENGMRGTMTLGGTTPRFTFRVQAGAEQYDNYQAGSFDVEDTRPYFADGTLNPRRHHRRQLRLHLQRFPDPFNAALRAHRQLRCLNSQAKGNFVNATGLVKLGDNRRCACAISVAASKTSASPTSPRRTSSTPPRCHPATSTSFSARYEAQADHAVAGQPVADRLLPARRAAAQEHAAGAVPGADAGTFFPINVMRLVDRVGDRSACVDAGHRRAGRYHAGEEPRADDRRHVLPRPQQRPPPHHDHDVDGRPGGARPARSGGRSCSRRPWQLGPATTARPVRVPNASLPRHRRLRAGRVARDAVASRSSAGLRADFYNVTTESHAGLQRGPAWLAGAVPAIDPSTLPDP